MRISFLASSTLCAFLLGAPVAQAGWTGCHVGVMAGYVGNDSKFTNLAAPPNLTGMDAKSGLTGGVEAGCDLGLPFFVVGLGASYDFLEASKANVRSEHIGAPPSTLDSTLTTRTTLGSIAAITGRVGVDIGPALLYVRAGGALAPSKMHYNYTIVHSIAGTAETDLSAKKTRSGYALGAGVEFALTSSLSVKLEYMHYDFGECNCLFSGTYSHPRIGTMPVKLLLKTEASVDTARAGLAYRF